LNALFFPEVTENVLFLKVDFDDDFNFIFFMMVS